MSNNKKKIIRITTIAGSLQVLLKGQLSYMSNHYELIGVSSQGKNNQLKEISEEEDISVIPIEMTRKITPFKDLLAVWNLYKLFKKEKPFIVHSHTPKAGTLGMLAAFLARVPNRLHTIAGLPLVETRGLKRLLLNSVEKITYACASKIYPNSFGLTDIILAHKFTSRKKIKVLANGSSNGIDVNYFSPDIYKEFDKAKLKKELGINKDDFVFIFVGRLVKDKGINELVESFNNLSLDFQDIKLLLVGDYETELDPLLPETINIINSNKKIISTGWVNDVRPYFSISNALTFPSYREGFPNVVLQAGAMELASIVTNINGCNEIIKNNTTGLIIPVKDKSALTKSMKSILLNKQNCYEMGKNSRINIANKYNQQKVWKAILEEYKQL